MCTGATPDVQFRDAVASDLAAIVGLLNDDDFGHARNPLLGEARDAYERAFNEMHADQNNGVVVAVQQDQIVGCYQLTFIRGLSFSGGLRAQIESVRVATALRGSGLGSAMMRDAIERARLRGAFMVQLTTDLRRPLTRAFYERLGFETSHHGMKLKF